MKDAGRRPEAVGITMRFQRFGDTVADMAGDGERRLFSGTTADLAGDIKALAAQGVGAIDMSFGGTTVPEIPGRVFLALQIRGDGEALVGFPLPR